MLAKKTQANRDPQKQASRPRKHIGDAPQRSERRPSTRHVAVLGYN